MTCKAAAVDMVAAAEVVDTEVSLRLRPGVRTRIYLASQLLLSFAWVAALIIIDLGWDL